MTKLLIGLSGRGLIAGKFASTARVGKDEVAKVIREDLGFRTYSFALPLKQVCQVLFGLTEEQLWNDNLKKVEIPLWQQSPRSLFQRLGTEGGRFVFDQAMWAKMAMFVWDDVQQERPYKLTHTGSTSVTSANPKTSEDFDRLLNLAAQAMFQLEDGDIAQSRLNGTPLRQWDYTFDEIKHKIRTETIPVILGMSDKPEEAWERFTSLRSTLPFVEVVSNGPYGTPSAQSNGLSVPDNRFDNEADTIREHGGHIIHVVRNLPPDIELVQGHSSEVGVTVKPNDLLLKNDSTLEALKHKTIDLVSSIHPDKLTVKNDNFGI